MALIIKDRVKEVTTTTGTGTITLAGASTGFRSFADIGNANTTYYCISGGSQFEVGLGTYTASGTTLSRDTVLSNSLGTTALINFSAGTKDVFVTYPSDKAMLGSTSAVSSTGTGSVVLNSNPTFATDITVNGLTVGKGDSNISTNTAFGVDAIGSPYITPTNINNVAVGYNALNQIGSAVATLNSATLVGGSGYDDSYDGYFVGLVYLSGTPPQAGVTNPDAAVSISGGQIVSVNLGSGGFGWTALDTVFAIDNTNIGGVGSGASIQIGSLTAGATNITAVGFGAGNSKTSGSNSIYLGSNATGTGSNEIVIGANATGFGNNTVVIGNASTTSTTLRGGFNLTGSATANQTIASAQTTGTLIIGGSGNATGTITLGQSTGAQTVGIATGANNINAKTLNLGTGATTGATTITLGSTGIVNGATTINIGTQPRTSGNTTVNIGTNATGGNANVNIGSSIGGSTTTIRSNSLTTTSTTIATFNGSATFNSRITQQTTTVGALPGIGGGAVVGMRMFVTDASSPVFGELVTGGSNVPVPVYYDGTSWRVG